MPDPKVPETKPTVNVADKPQENKPEAPKKEVNKDPRTNAEYMESKGVDPETISDADKVSGAPIVRRAPNNG